jgi:hypothetical protein
LNKLSAALQNGGTAKSNHLRIRELKDTLRSPMTFQSSSRDLAGGIPYDDALQLLLLGQPSNNLYQQGPLDYLPQSSSTVYQPLEHDYGRVCAQTFSEDPPLQPPPELDTGQQRAPHDFASVLEELRKGISSIQTKCDNLAATYAFHQATLSNITDRDGRMTLTQTKCDNLAATYAFHQATFSNITDRDGRMKTFISEVTEYIELNRAWCLIFKRAMESQNTRAAGSEDSEDESQGN